MKNRFLIFVIWIILLCTTCTNKNEDSKESSINQGIPVYEDMQIMDNESIKKDSAQKEKIQDITNFNPLEDSIKEIVTKNWGNVQLIPGVEKDEYNSRKLGLYLVDEYDIIQYKFPEFSGNKWILFNLEVIELNDINNDELIDIIIIAYFTAGNGVEEFPVAGVYFQKANEFVSIPDIDKAINEDEIISIECILENIKNLEIKLE